MKKLILFLLFSGIAFGQNYKDLTETEFNKEVGNIVEATNENLIYSQEDSNNGTPFEASKLKVYKNEAKVLKIRYFSHLKGENINLEVKGTPSYSIESIYGKFLTVFPIWKKYVDENADAEQLSSKKKTEKDVGNFKWSLHDYGENTWVIKIDKREAKQKFERLIVPFVKSKKGYEFKKPIPKEVEEQIKIDFAKDENGNYTGYYDVFYLDDIPSKIRLTARTNR
ncbi:MAG: hypothetical protein QM564_11590 [Bergeyella sp.]